MDSFDYNEDFQYTLIQFMLSSNDLFSRSRNIIESKYFDQKFVASVKFILKYSDEHGKLPLPEQVKGNTGFDISIFPKDAAEMHSEWYLHQIEQFCRHKEIEGIITKAPKALEKGDYGKVEEDIKKAMLISLTKTLGLDFFNEPDTLIERLQTSNKITSTGWKTIDEKLYGGFNRGELNIFAGAPGTGKSLVLQNLSMNWIEQSLDVVYLTFELSEELVGMRFNAMITQQSTKNVFRNKEDVGLKVRMLHKKNSWGKLTVKFMPVGSSTNDLRAYLKEYEIQNGKKPDALIVDYLDLMHPNSRRVSPSDLFVKDKYVSEELRSFAAENNLLFATASQLNRQAMEEQDHEMYHIAGGVSKINTADNVMTIYTSDVLKQRGEYKIQFIKTRSSSGVGHRVILAYDVECLRIRDQEEAEQKAKIGKMTKSEVGDQIKRKIKEENKEENKNDAKKSEPESNEESEQVVSKVRDIKGLMARAKRLSE